MSKTLQKDRSFLLPYAIAALFSLFLSFLAGYREVVLNPDAICYLESAKAIMHAGLKAGMQLCDQANWPFYSLLIASFARLTHSSYLVSAYVLNGFFSALSILCFLAILRELGATRRILWWGVFVFLCAHELNSIRQYIIRDHGFFAFYLLSLFFLLRYCRTPRFQQAIGFSLSLSVATLFRIEGAIFLLLLPFLFLFQRGYALRARLVYFMQLQALTCGVLILFAGYLLLHAGTSLEQFGRVHEILDQMQYGIKFIIERYHQTQAALAQHVLSKDSVHEAGMILFVVFVVWYIFSVITNLSWIYSGLVLYALKTGSFIKHHGHRFVLCAYLVINVVITGSFLLQHLFLSKRYLVALTLLLLVWVPFGLETLWQRWWKKGYKSYVAILLVLIFCNGITGIFSMGYSKAYLRAAGDWLAQNVAPQNALYVDDYQVMYYSQHFGEKIFQTYKNQRNLAVFANDEWKKYDYFAFRINKKDVTHIEAEAKKRHLEPIQIFTNKRGDAVLIFRK